MQKGLIFFASCKWTLEACLSLLKKINTHRDKKIYLSVSRTGSTGLVLQDQRMERGTIFSSASLIQKYPALHSAFVISKMLLKIAVWSDSSSTVLSKSKNKQPPVFKMLVTLLVNHLDYLLFADMRCFFFFSWHLCTTQINLVYTNQKLFN